MKQHPWANTLLLFLLGLQLLTGFWGLFESRDSGWWILGLHGVGGYAIAVLFYWKGKIIWQALSRDRRWSLARLAFLLLTGLVLFVLASGFLWSYGGRRYWFGFSLINLHAFVACGLLLLLGWHLAAKWFVWRIPAARNRRAFMRLGRLGLAGLLLRQLAEPAKALAHLPGAARRFTGSYEVGSFGGYFPPTSWLFDDPAPLEATGWRLELSGAVERPLRLSYEELLALAGDTQTALLDCTGGFYTVQEWQGLPLSRLLDQAGAAPTARSVTLESVTGYARRFPLSEAPDLLLATHVAGQPLEHGHGFPLRLVAPGYRGYDWVKWIVAIRLNTSGPLWQPPLPLQ